jgi:hypothetical protein
MFATDRWRVDWPAANVTAARARSSPRVSTGQIGPPSSPI